MCGIAGVLLHRRDSVPATVFRDRGRAMADILYHRGPDGFGVWTDPSVALVHTRLAIIDTSAAGNQPMHDDTGRFHLIFNGEIYNFQALRRELLDKGYRFHGHSDTEVILNGYREWGTAVFSRLVGMFAIAIWDGAEQRLVLARDRFGEKPLYYYNSIDSLVFASEIKAILTWPDVPRRPSHAAIHDYLTFGYTLGPGTAFAGIHRLQPAHYMVIEPGRPATTHRYWQLPEPREQKPRVLKDLRAELIERLRSSVHACLVSDVPLGAFLSGGVDSSAVVALMSEVTGAHVKTFSSGFGFENYDETAYATQVADRYGTDHQVHIFDDRLLAATGKLAWHYGEPYSDSSSLVTFALAREVRKSVTVALSGDGADEILLGYQRYQRYGKLLADAKHGRQLSQLYLRRPLDARRALAVDTYGYLVERLRERHKVEAYAPDFVTQLENCSYDRLLPHVPDSEDAEEIASRMDIATYLPDDILVKVDVAAMANSLETRAPFLNHEFAEFVATIPVHQRTWNGEGKALLKQALEPYLPHETLYRTKMGFRVPVARYMRELARPECEATLLSDRFLDRGIVTRDYVQTLLNEHTVGSRQDHGTRLWALMMMEMWHRNWIDDAGRTPLADKDNPFARFAAAADMQTLAETRAGGSAPARPALATVN
ncbi:asparagine synthase (glutamine-hydrolyzing) [Niveispirillum sp. KHB5.9]|uniref:asparagine synthase (glutamine-hydrolyzing) n=1 Tax=Niveispirillum sp. KHB5.9 TaxID=3400269 RepID=UPI003A8BB023